MTSGSMPRLTAGGAVAHDSVPVVTVAWQVIAAVKLPTGGGGALAS